MLFRSTCRRPSGRYSFETCLALLPQLPTWLRVDLFLLPSAIPKPPRLLLLLEVKLVHTVESKSWFKYGIKWRGRCAAESGKHSGNMSAFVPFFISSATFSFFSQEIGPLPPTLRHPPCFLHLINQETSWVASIYYFPPFPLRTKS